MMWPFKSREPNFESLVQALPDEEELRRMPTPRLIFLAAAWTQLGRDLYESGSEDLRAGVNRDELRLIDDAICIAKEIAMDFDSWTQARFRADQRAATLTSLFMGLSGRSRVQHDHLYTTCRGTEKFDPTESEQASTYRDMLARMIREDVAAAAYYAVQAAGNGPTIGTYGRPNGYDAAYGAHMTLQHLQGAAHTVQSLGKAPYLRQATGALRRAQRDFIRLRDLTQNPLEHPGPPGSEPDNAHDWRLKILSSFGCDFESEIRGLPLPGGLVLMIRAVERSAAVVEELRGELHGSYEVSGVLDAIRAKAINRESPDPPYVLGLRAIAKPGQQAAHVALLALREAGAAVEKRADPGQAKARVLAAILSAVEVSYWRNGATDGEWFAGEFARIRELAARDRWTDTMAVPRSAF